MDPKLRHARPHRLDLRVRAGIEETPHLFPTLSDDLLSAGDQRTNRSFPGRQSRPPEDEAAPHVGFVGLHHG